MSEFEHQPGNEPAIDKLAAALHQQAKDTGQIQYDDQPPAPNARHLDERVRLDSEHDAAVAANSPGEVPGADASSQEEVTDASPGDTEEAPAEETPSSDEEIYSADAVIRLDDGSEVTARELAEGSLRHADYTQKTQQLSEQRKEMEAQTQGLVGQWQERSQQLGQLADAMTREINSSWNPAEMQQLSQDDPGEYAKRVLQYQQRQQMVAAAKQEQVNLDAQQQQARVPYERQALTAKNKTFADNFDDTYRQVGEWVLDPSGGGLSPEIWNGVYDHRFVDIAHKAMMWDKMQAQAASGAPRIREQAQKPRVIRPGVSQPTKSPKSVAQEDYQRILGDKDGMRTNDGIAAAFLARERMK